MIRYLALRLLRAAIVLLAVSAISFGLFELAPGNYFDEFRLDAGVSPELLASLRQQQGTDQPVAVRYLRWLTAAARGDWGISVAYNSPVAPLLFGRAANTLILTVSAVVCAWLIALPFGFWAAMGRSGRGTLADMAAAFLSSLPDVIVVLVLIAVAAHSGLVPAGGMTSVHASQLGTWGAFVDLVRHLLVPLTALVVSSLATLILHVRSAAAEALRSPFLLFGKANGIPAGRLLLRYTLPAAANPLITLMGLSAGTLLSSSLVVEAVSGWPGLGHLLFQALVHRDYVVVADAVLLSSVFLVCGNLLADMLLYAVDPRIREHN
jgi:peptide/nickel transport system permease protein